MKLDAEVGERAEQVRPPATGSVVAVIAAFHPAHARDGLYVFVRQGQIGVEVTPVEGVRQSVLKFHFLLRHRLLRQPHGFEGLRMAHIELLWITRPFLYV